MHDVAAARSARARRLSSYALAALAAMAAGPVWAAAAAAPALYGIPVDFILFGITLLCVGIFHHHTLAVALTGLVIVSAYKLGFTGFKTGDGLGGLVGHFVHEWVILTNLLGLLLGFALLARHFEDSGALPKDRKSDQMHDDPIITLNMFIDDPNSVRYDARVKAGKATIDGVSIADRAKATELAKQIVAFRADYTVAAITKALAARGKATMAQQ